QRWHAAGKFNHLDATFHIAAGFDQRLTMLTSVAAHQFLEVFFEQHFELEENSRTLDGGCFHPCGKCSRGGLDGRIDVLRGAHRGFSYHLAYGGVKNGRTRDGVNIEPFATDEEGAWREPRWTSNLHNW